MIFVLLKACLHRSLNLIELKTVLLWCGFNMCEVFDLWFRLLRWLCCRFLLCTSSKKEAALQATEGSTALLLLCRCWLLLFSDLLYQWSFLLCWRTIIGRHYPGDVRVAFRLARTSWLLWSETYLLALVFISLFRGRYGALSFLLGVQLRAHVFERRWHVV